jgi:hypothetical protein
MASVTKQQHHQKAADNEARHINADLPYVTWPLAPNVRQSNQICAIVNATTVPIQLFDGRTSEKYVYPGKMIG